MRGRMAGMDDQQVDREGGYRMSRSFKIFLYVLGGFFFYAYFIEYLVAWLHSRK
jgi:hypothetical protein